MCSSCSSSPTSSAACCHSPSGLSAATAAARPLSSCSRIPVLRAAPGPPRVLVRLAVSIPLARVGGEVVVGAQRCHVEVVVEGDLEGVAGEGIALVAPVPREPSRSDLVINAWTNTSSQAQRPPRCRARARSARPLSRAGRRRSASARAAPPRLRGQHPASSERTSNDCSSIPRASSMFPSCQTTSASAARTRAAG